MFFYSLFFILLSYRRIASVRPTHHRCTQVQRLPPPDSTTTLPQNNNNSHEMITMNTTYQQQTRSSSESGWRLTSGDFFIINFYCITILLFIILITCTSNTTINVVLNSDESRSRCQCTSQCHSSQSRCFFKYWHVFTCNNTGGLHCSHTPQQVATHHLTMNISHNNNERGHAGSGQAHYIVELEG